MGKYKDYLNTYKKYVQPYKPPLLMQNGGAFASCAFTILTDKAGTTNNVNVSWTAFGVTWTFQFVKSGSPIGPVFEVDCTGGGVVTQANIATQFAAAINSTLNANSPGHTYVATASSGVVTAVARSKGLIGNANVAPGTWNNGTLMSETNFTGGLDGSLVVPVRFGSGVGFMPYQNV